MAQDGQETKPNEYFRHSFIDLSIALEWGVDRVINHYKGKTMESCIRDGGVNVELINSTFMVNRGRAQITTYLKAGRLHNGRN